MGVRVLGYGSLTLPIFNLSPNTRHFRPMRLWTGGVFWSPSYKASFLTLSSGASILGQLEDYLPPGIVLTLLTWRSKVPYMGFNYFRFCGNNPAGKELQPIADKSFAK